MLPCEDMLNVMLQVAIRLVQTAVFATLAGPPSNEVTRRRIHPLLNL